MHIEMCLAKRLLAAQNAQLIPTTISIQIIYRYM